MVDEAIEQTREQALEALHAEFALWDRTEGLPEFFWRDDDLAHIVPSLERFLEISERRQIPIVFAAIPAQLTHGAAQAIRKSSNCRIAIHGFNHKNQAPAGVPDSEYPENRSLDAVFAELQEGVRLVESKAQERYLSMFVPPWGRFHPSFDVLLGRAGIASFSGDGKSPRYSVPIQHDCQVVTEHGQVALPMQIVLGRVTRHLELRRTGLLPRLQPIGIMTHHRIFTPELEVVLEELLDILQAQDVRFSHFAEIDAVMNKTAAVTGAARPPVGAHGTFTTAAQSPSLRAITQRLLEPTLASADAGFVGLAQVQMEVAKTNTISSLRYSHMQHTVAALPPGARVLSAGCGKALPEVALAIAHPELTWVAVDVDAARYQYALGMAREFDVTNIEFRQVDLCQLDEAALAALGKFDAITMTEVAMYVPEPRRVLADVANLLHPGGTLTNIEPFVADADPATLEKLRHHTQSLHGGFTHQQMASFFTGLELVHQGNCYFGESYTLADQLWRHMSKTGDWSLTNLLFAVGRLDLDGSMVTARRDAVAVKVVARRKA